MAVLLLVGACGWDDYLVASVAFLGWLLMLFPAFVGLFVAVVCLVLLCCGFACGLLDFGVWVDLIGIGCRGCLLRRVCCWLALIDCGLWIFGWFGFVINSVARFHGCVYFNLCCDLEFWCLVIWRLYCLDCLFS